MTHDPADDFDHPKLPERHPLRRHMLYRLASKDWRTAPVTKTYFACHWHHSSEDQPVEFYGELDEGRRELRKIEVYRDGRSVVLGPEDIEPGARSLAEGPIPPFEQLEADPQFDPREITPEEFEVVWRRYSD